MYVCMYVTNEWIFRQWDGCNRGSWVQMTTRSTRLCRQRERKRERERERALFLPLVFAQITPTLGITPIQQNTMTISNAH